MITTPGQIIGTLEYMSPEQADPGVSDIDTRSDVYSLGVVLYELLSGRRPFELATTGDTPLLALRCAIVEQDPPTPSARLRRDTALSQVAPRHGTDGRSLIRQLTGDIDWICLKALEKEPARRYQSVAELADDLRRHLADQPVLARRPEWHYRLRKFTRRHRVGVAAGVLVAGSTIAGAFGVVSGRLDAAAAKQVTKASKPYSDAFLLAQLVNEADDQLWPPYPDKIGQLNAWIARAHALAATLDGPDGHRADLAAMDAHPRTDTEHMSRHATLVALVDGLSRLEDDATGLLGNDPKAVSPDHGWSVPRRLAFAQERLAAGFADGGNYAAMWERYPDSPIAPQMGLVPIGRDPDSKLWEFAHLLTGTVPERDVDRRIVRSEDMAVILVLIPEGTFRMGHGQERGTAEGAGEVPRGAGAVHDVTLSAHFVSKHEMTQGQWLRLTGSDPSRYRPGKPGWQEQWLDRTRIQAASWLHPVEQVSWVDCDLWLRRAGLRLPTEAEWEQAARAGTETAFWTGPAGKSLEGAANVFDQYVMGHGRSEHDGMAAAFDDGATMHTPVGCYRANRYGLYDVHGNVFEWCRDAWDIDYYADSPKHDPQARIDATAPRIYRGGSYRVPPVHARSSARSFYPPTMIGTALGVRPAATIVAR